MKTFNKFAVGAALLFGAAAISSCSSSKDKNDFLGTWTSSAPETVVPTIEGTTGGTATSTFEFSQGTDPSNGPVKLTTDYVLQAPDSTGATVNYTVKASVEGKWTRDDKDDEDVYLAFDQNTLDVAAVGGPDGLGGVTSSFLGSLSQYTKIDDLEVSKDGTVLTFELNNASETKVSFTKK